MIEVTEEVLVCDLCGFAWPWMQSVNSISEEESSGAGEAIAETANLSETETTPMPVVHTTFPTNTTTRISKRTGRRPEMSEARLRQTLREFHEVGFIPPENRPSRGMKKTIRKIVEEVVVETKTKPQATQTITTLRGLLLSLREFDSERVKQRVASLQQ